MRITIYLSFIIFLMASCCKDPDPCAGQSEVKAKFYANNKSYYLPSWVKPYWIMYDWKNQSTLGAQFVVDSTVKWESLEWHIGSEVIKDEPSVYRNNFPDEADIPVTLIIRNKPNRSCFPQDDGIDTLTKVYHFTSKTNRLIGTFRGAFTDVPGRTDTFEFTTLYGELYGPSDFRTYDSTVFSIDTFPFIGCRYQPTFGANTNESFAYAFGKTWCTNPDDNRRIGSIYIRCMDNVSNKIELIFNAASDKNDPSDIKYPLFHWKGYKIK